jgi:2-polyprenyl-3-methyl-5-hydroxy-6-metoxy-1,4-benzoquinol methylase
MSVLEIGCGAGQFLRYLKARGFSDTVGVDYDENLAEVLSDIEGCEFVCADANDYVAKVSGARTFDRIVLFDILEHMELDDAIQLLKGLRSILSKGGKVLLRMPNVSSPWGQRMFYGSFDHVTPYTPDRVKELAFMTGYTCLNVVGQTTGKWRKRVLENALHGILNRVLTYHPQIWQANLLCVFELKNKED